MTALQIWQSWLLDSSEEEFKKQQANRLKPPEGFHPDGHSHSHDHDHGHSHEEREQVELNAIKAEGDDAEKARLIQALIKVGPWLITTIMILLLLIIILIIITCASIYC